MKAFIVTVPFTIIEAVHFVISEDICDADLYLVNVFSNAKEIYENIKKTNVFKNVYFVEDVLLTYPISIKKCFRILKNGKNFIKKNKEKKYNEIYYNNSGWLINSFFYTAFCGYSDDVKNNFLEHGYYTYTNDYAAKPWYMKPLIRICGMKCMDGSMLDKLYMFHPEIMRMPTTAQIMKMKPMDRNNKRLVDSLNTIFDYNPNDDEFRDYDTIILEQGPLKEEYDKEAFWERVINLLNKEHTIVKAHPRQKDSCLTNMGIHVCKNHTIPWEIVMLNTDIASKTQITLFSGACVTPKLLLDEEPTIIFLYKIAPLSQSMWGEGLKQFANDLGSLYNDKAKYFIPDSWEELEAYLN